MMPDSQQLVESGEMIHVPMADEDVADAKQLAIGQAGEIADVEQHRAASEPEVEQQAGIGERLVDEAALNQLGHDLRTFPHGAAYQ